MNHAMISIGKTIRKLRIERGISQQDLAEDADLTPSFLSLVENGRRRPSLAVIQRLASSLLVPEEILIWDSVELPNNLNEKDRRLCEMAKMIVRRFYEAGYAQSAPGQG
jgi:transcriptional regulator with XRE-family HTH domain